MPGNWLANGVNKWLVFHTFAALQNAVIALLVP